MTRAEVQISEQQAQRLQRMYPSATSLPEAIRHAIQELICRRENELTPDAISEAIVDALDDVGCTAHDD